jgi:YD repeat-containing protein
LRHPEIFVEGRNSNFWHPPLWKWALALALVVCSMFLFLWKPAAHLVKVELLPFTDAPPAWDGSYPYMVISLLAGPGPGSGPVKFQASISQLQPTVRHDAPVNDFLVDLHTGRFILRQTDLFVPDVMPLSLTRTYVVWDYHSRAFGVGGNHPYDICPTGTRNPYTYMDLNLEGDRWVHMRRISKGTGYADAVFRHEETASEFYGMQVAWNGNGWILTFRDGRKFYFPESYHAKNCAQGAPTEMVDAQGNRIQLKRDQVRNLQELISPSGHSIKFQYDSSDRIIEAAGDDGHIRKYSYDSGGHVETVSDGTHVLYRFEYAPLIREAGYDPWLLTAVLDGDWNVLLENKYHWGRVSEQKLADREIYRYDYQLKGRDVLQTTVTLPSGEKKSFSLRDGILIGQK